MAVSLPKTSAALSNHLSFVTNVLVSKNIFPFQKNQRKHNVFLRRHYIPNITNAISNPSFTFPEPPSVPKSPSIFVSRFASDEPRKGSEVLIEALEREGVTNVFAYPGEASLEIHQALTRSKIIRNVLPRHEQGGVFAAEGYARVSGKPGVCIATAGPGATNLVSGLADAHLDGVPIVAITGQVPRKMIGTDSFQTPIVEVTRSITKHNYVIMNVEDFPRIVREAFFLARSGRPGPILIDVPKDIQEEMVVPIWDQSMKLTGYLSRLRKKPNEIALEQILRFMGESKRPILCIGGGCLNSSKELIQFVNLTGIPVACTLMGLGAFPTSNEKISLQMLGRHGAVYANYAVDNSDLLLAFGVRFDDRVTGKLEAFASRAKIVYIDIDSSEIGKNKQAHLCLCADVKLALKRLNSMLEARKNKLQLDFSAWREELKEQKIKHPLRFKTFGDAIPPQGP